MHDESLLRRTIKNSLSGTVAGVAICLVGHPFDTLKVRLQTQPVHNPVYNGLLDCFLKTMKWEGIGGLYKGVGSPLVGQMFFRATMFTSYYQISTHLAGPERAGKRLKRHEYFICGAGTGFVSGLVEGPIDLFKTKMQIQIIRAQSGHPQQYRHVFHAGYVITKTYGLRGAYQGLGATWLRNIPACALYFGFFEVGRDFFARTYNEDPNHLKAPHLLASGSLGGFLYWFCTYPTDVIKSSMQSDDSAKGQRKFRNMLDCAIKLYRDEGGWRRFFRGMSPCLMRSIPANAVMMTTLEKCRQLMHKLEKKYNI